MDANEYALAVQPATKSLGLVIRQAEWLGKGAAPSREPVVVDVPARAGVLSLTAALELEAVQDEAAASEAAPAASSSLPEPPAYRVPPSTPAMPFTISDSGELVLTLGDRVYRVRGIEKNLSYELLKVSLRVTRGAHFHLDLVELSAVKARAAWVRAAAIELGLSEEVAKSDLGQVLQAAETQRDALIQQKLKPSANEKGAAALTPAQHDAAMALLRDPNLIERIVADVEATGVVGEASNALVAYLACVSRKLDKPLAILIQSTSAAGKSTLMDALLALMPESERVHYSAMTGQSLFYLGEHSMKHKILAIAEEEGVRQAAYALKVLQSQGELTIASTGKDPATGQLVTQEYRVEGPVMLFLTTTAIDIDEELLNRCLVLTINESREQTAAIQAKQRAARTLAGLMNKARSDDLVATHRAAQQLLRPLAVVNPFAEQLTFASDRVRLRRDHAKYLALIDSIALLHQHQRSVQSTTHAGKLIEYIEVTAADIALANRLAHEVLGRSLDELPPQTRRVLGHMQQFVATQAHQQAIERVAVRFTRRALRDALGLSEKQLRVHVDRLVELDYVIAHHGRNGQRFVYELAFDGDVGNDAPQAIGLVAIDGLGVATTTNLVGVEADLVGRSWPARGDLVATSSAAETPLIASAGADVLPLTAALPETAPRKPRVNGASYRSATAAVR
jgi:post-segregation antitoxin (ccd killing protein)